MRRVALFIFFQISLMSGLMEGEQDSRICFCIQSIAIFWVCLRCEDNMVSHRSKDRNILIAIPDNCGYSSFILYENLTSASSLKVCCNVEFETIL